MKTHQEIHNMIESFYGAGETAFTAAEILHALNDRIEALGQGLENVGRESAMTEQRVRHIEEHPQ